MTLFGVGGFEWLLIGAIALFVLGPKRLLEGIREGRRIYTDLKRQRDALQSMITEAIDLEDLKKQTDPDGVVKGLVSDAESLKDDLALDQVTDDVKEATDVEASKSKESVDERDSGSVSRTKQLYRPPIVIDSEMRDSIPDLDIGATESEASDDEAKS